MNTSAKPADRFDPKKRFQETVSAAGVFTATRLPVGKADVFIRLFWAKVCNTSPSVGCLLVRCRSCVWKKDEGKGWSQLEQKRRVRTDVAGRARKPTVGGCVINL